jgi:hypothetical protein
MWSRYKRYNVYLSDKRRTSISIEEYMADMMALKLEYPPGTKEAHSAIRQWIQNEQDKLHYNKIETYAIKKYMFLELADKKLNEKYWDYTLAQEEKENRKKTKKRG